VLLPLLMGGCSGTSDESAPAREPQDAGASSSPTASATAADPGAGLAVHPVVSLVADADASPSSPDHLVLATPDGEALELGPSVITGGGVSAARAQPGASEDDWLIALRLTDEGAQAWAAVTGRAACQPEGAPGRRVAFVVGEEIIASPEVQASVACDVGIRGSETWISGGFSEQEAEDLAGEINGR
jgi:SecD/SecF fusion protein